MGTYDATIDRMSVAGNDDSTPTSWNVMLKGRNDVRIMRRYHLVSTRHIGLTREGDAVRITENDDGTIVGFANLTLLQKQMPTASAEAIAAAAYSHLVKAPPAPVHVRIISTLIGVAVMAVTLGGMFWMMNWMTSDMNRKFDAIHAEREVQQREMEAGRRVVVAKDVIARCGTLADQARTFLKDRRIDVDEIEVLDTRLRQVRAAEGIASCPVRAPLDGPV